MWKLSCFILLVSHTATATTVSWKRKCAGTKSITIQSHKDCVNSKVRKRRRLKVVGWKEHGEKVDVFVRGNCTVQRVQVTREPILTETSQREKALRDYSRSLACFCAPQKSLATKYLNMIQASECRDPNGVTEAATSIDSVIQDMNYHLLQAHTVDLEQGLEKTVDHKIPMPPAHLLASIGSYADTMRTSISNDIFSSKRKTPETFRPIKNSEEVASNFKNEFQCSSGGFLTKGIRSYEFECRGPKKTKLNSVFGVPIDLSCAPEESEDLTLGKIPKSAYDKMQMCNPLLYGYIPLGQEENVSRRGLPLCALPRDLGDGAIHRPYTMNKFCERGEAWMTSNLPKNKEKDAMMDMVAKLHMNNKGKSSEILNGIKLHCGGISSNMRLNNKNRRYEKESCISLLNRVQRIEEALIRYEGLVKKNYKSSLPISQ